jgi:membrane-bound inhibitor of C-type lysozyme
MILDRVDPAKAQTFVTYHCQDGTEFIAAFYQSQGVVYLRLDGKDLTLPQRIAASGARYAKGGITLWIKDNGASLRRARRTTQCSAD